MLLYIIICLVVGLGLRSCGETQERSFLCGLFWPLWLFGLLLK